MAKKSKANKKLEAVVITPEKSAPPAQPAEEKTVEKEAPVESKEAPEGEPVAEPPLEAPVEEVKEEVDPNAPKPIPEGMIRIVFNEKEVDVTPIEPGIVQKTDSIFYLLDSISGKWLYCSPTRLATLREKKTDFANYMGRDSAKAHRAFQKELKKKAREAGKEAKEKVLEEGMKNAPWIAPELRDDAEVKPEGDETPAEEVKAEVAETPAEEVKTEVE